MMLIQAEVEIGGCFACEVCEIYDSNHSHGHSHRPREKAMMNVQATKTEFTVIDSTSSSIGGQILTGDIPIKDQLQSFFDDAIELPENRVMYYNEEEEIEKQQPQISPTIMEPPRKTKGPVGAHFKFGKSADGFFNGMRKWIQQHHNYPYLLPRPINLKNLNIVISNYPIEAYHYLLIQSKQEFPPIGPTTIKERNQLHKRKAFKMKAIKILKDYGQKMVPLITI